MIRRAIRSFSGRMEPENRAVVVERTCPTCTSLQCSWDPFFAFPAGKLKTVPPSTAADHAPHANRAASAGPRLASTGKDKKFNGHLRRNRKGVWGWMKVLTRPIRRTAISLYCVGDQPWPGDFGFHRIKGQVNVMRCDEKPSYL